MLLSIVTPFFNSIGKCQRLLATLSAIDDSAVELVFVDDGSTDGTARMLEGFSGYSKLTPRIILQANNGPGSARNAGLAAAVGDYVWFVDSDDDIDISVLSEIKLKSAEGFDFIDFDYLTGGAKTNSMGFVSGAYTEIVSIRKDLFKGFGRICTKVFKRDFLIKNNIKYPELCIYEDNSLVFVLPLLVEKFYKSDAVGYYHYENFLSVTRSDIGLRYFDRLKTAEFGVSWGKRVSQNFELVEVGERFLRLYLINTIRKLTGRGRVRYWFVAMRVMRQYRAVADSYELRLSPFNYLSGSVRRKIIFYFLWYASYVLSEQSGYFAEMHLKAWGRQPVVKGPGV